ncbi:Tripartite-type tricarboxylate transporter, receptor component TctC [Variovorax sp. HW608]|uniref:Bug family tripartite tricarboxylate transporter substrate binding protein n=1 Tax=Variovorax sp. HW608 TaxID=1034889 RepID=UPI0008201A18|nr:tripartite tricarboxylate transporter substrate binding protein [Variovorax sp. HW608]SCK18706.1 Tripartite-type tricarboxylate transporter, receptor component TctC [Variovorax sp. HW608]
MRISLRSKPTRRRALHLACALLGGPLFAGTALADWPADKTIRMVVPFAAGGATDSLGRALAFELTKSLKQNVIVDNRPGAGGNLGAQQVAMSPPDGYTLLLASGSMFTVNQFIYAKPGYTLNNFALISKVASGPMVVTVNSDLPVKNTKELIAYIKERPAKVSFASAGVGSQTHMAGESLADAAGLELLHVPYKGEGPAYADLMGGTVQLAVANINAMSPLLKGGRLRALSVTGKERSPLLPNVPTTAEDGVPGFEYMAWFALVAPAGTPKPAIDRLIAEVKAAVNEPGMKRYLADQGMSAAVVPPEPLKVEIASEASKWKLLVEKKKLSAN